MKKKKVETHTEDIQESETVITEEAPATTFERNGLTKNQWTLLGGVAVLLLVFATVTLMVNNASITRMDSKITSQYRTTMSECVSSAERDVSERSAYTNRVDSEIIDHTWKQLKHDAAQMSPRQVNDTYGGANAFCVEVWNLAKHPTYHRYPPIQLPYQPYALEGNVGYDMGESAPAYQDDFNGMQDDVTYEDDGYAYSEESSTPEPREREYNESSISEYGATIGPTYDYYLESAN